MYLEKQHIRNKRKKIKLELELIKFFMMAQQDHESLTEDSFKEIEWSDSTALVINVDEVFVRINGKGITSWLDSYCNIVSYDSKQIIITGWRTRVKDV